MIEFEALETRCAKWAEEKRREEVELTGIDRDRSGPDFEPAHRLLHGGLLQNQADRAFGVAYHGHKDRVSICLPSSAKTSKSRGGSSCTYLRNKSTAESTLYAALPEGRILWDAGSLVNHPMFSGKGADSLARGNFDRT